jgi:predicted nucleic acid-binding protein
MDDAAISRYVAQIEASSLLVQLSDEDVVPVVSDDPDDDEVLATAIIGQADVLCSLDRHIRRPEVVAYCHRFGVRVRTDLELLTELRQSEQ